MRFRSSIRHFWRWVAIKTGAYPKFILHRLFNWQMRRCFRNYSKLITDNMFEPNPIFAALRANGRAKNVGEKA